MVLYYAVLFAAKVLDNTLSTAKTILIQRNRCILAGISLAASNFIYYWITKLIVTSDGVLAILIVSLASGVGCCLAVAVNNRLSKEKAYVNVVMSDNRRITVRRCSSSETSSPVAISPTWQQTATRGIGALKPSQ
ncbi:MAG TPA: hypothetical protein PLM48_08310 [Clostridia bacterium]|nr:hypothetical protein [Clostridia bacterium]